MGVYGFAVVSLLGNLDDVIETDNILDIIASVLEIIQPTLQTAFLFDASKRALPVPNPEMISRDIGGHGAIGEYNHVDKPGREMIMFLLANNFAQWALNVSGMS